MIVRPRPSSPRVSSLPPDWVIRAGRTFAITAMRRGCPVWRGWIVDDEAADDFVRGLVTDRLPRDTGLHELPTPAWRPWLHDPDITYEFATVAFLVTTPGTNASWTSPADWDNANNTIECIGAGGSGGVARGSVTTREVTGGGGGAYSKIANFSVATPGTSTVTYRIGAGGPSVVQGAPSSTVNGNPGGATWWNDASDPGAGTDNTKCSAKGGSAGLAGDSGSAGALGGVDTAGWGETRRSGGNSGASTTGGGASGGGGAAGPNGVGGTSADAGLNVATDGAAGDGGSGGAGSAKKDPSGLLVSDPGGDGAEYNDGSGTAGSGGGSGGVRSSNNNATSGPGGLAGGGSGGAISSPLATSGLGGRGLIVVTYTPAAGGSGIISILLRQYRSRVM